MIKYNMIDNRSDKYITLSNGEIAVVTEVTKQAYEDMYANFNDNPLKNIKFVSLEEPD